MIRAIDKRTSIRSFEKAPLNRNDISSVRLLLNQSISKKGPFDHSIKLRLELKENKGKDSTKIGAYGEIKNAPSFLIGFSKNTFKSLVDFGYLFEEIILELTKMGFGTCIVGGNLKVNTLLPNISLNEWIIPAVTPVGYEPKKENILDKIKYTGKQSKVRKDIHKIYEVHQSSLPQNDIDLIVQKVSLAPSSENRQPWRLIFKDKEIIVCLKRDTKRSSKNLKYDIQAVDIGIALFHIETTLKHLFVGFDRDMSERTVAETYTYILSYTLHI